MSAWKNVKDKMKNNHNAAEAGQGIYKKIASCGVNQFFAVKPTFYLGSAYVCAASYVDYVDKLLKAKEKDYSEVFKNLVCLRECAKMLLVNVNGLNEPLEALVQQMEEIYEGEEYEDDDEDLDAVEQEDIEEPRNNAETEKYDQGKNPYREDFLKEREALAKEISFKLKEICENEKISLNLAVSISLVYEECVQFAREVMRMHVAPEGDISTILSILVDMQFGLEVLLKNYITEDMSKDEEYNFNLGFLIWSAHYLNEITNKLNEEKI